MLKLPTAFLEVPEALHICNAPTSEAELSVAMSVREEYIIRGPSSPYAETPYMVDVCRAFRLARDAEVYVELGTQDKGNLAWLARTKLKKGATIIDIDWEEYPENEKKIRRELERDFEYHAIRGNCLTDEVVDQLERVLRGRKADVIFGDSYYTYAHAMTEFALYSRFVRHGGFFLLHDAEWPGNDYKAGGDYAKKGKGLAIQHLDRFYPAWMVFGGEQPLYRPVPIPGETPHWAVVAVFPL